MLDPNFTSRKVWFLSGLKIKYGRHKSSNLIELVILLQIYQFLISFEIGNDLASIPSRQLFILAVAGLTILPISFHLLFYYLWKTGQEKINAVAAEILLISIPRSYLFIPLFVIISTVVNAIREQTGVSKYFWISLDLMILVQILSVIQFQLEGLKTFIVLYLICCI